MTINCLTSGILEQHLRKSQHMSTTIRTRLMPVARVKIHWPHRRSSFAPQKLLEEWLPPPRLLLSWCETLHGSQSTVVRWVWGIAPCSSPPANRQRPSARPDFGASEQAEDYGTSAPSRSCAYAEANWRIRTIRTHGLLGLAGSDEVTSMPQTGARLIQGPAAVPLLALSQLLLAGSRGNSAAGSSASQRRRLRRKPNTLGNQRSPRAMLRRHCPVQPTHQPGNQT